MITVQNLNFDYRDKRVLHDISFTVREGDITALVGPNGAGKTTLLRSLVGLDTPLTGSIHVNGIDVLEEPRKAHACIGYLSDFFGLYEGLTVRQCLLYTGWSHGLRGSILDERIEQAAKDTQIADKMGALSTTLSRGYRQRVGIAMTLLHEPKLLVLDEPASGMDPEARHALSQLMHKLQRQGKTILVSSHILSELEDYCTDMLVIREGRVAEHVRLAEYQKQSVRTLTVTLLEANEAYCSLIETFPSVVAVRYQSNTLAIDFTGDAAAQAALLKTLLANDIPVIGFGEEHHTLQSAYMNIAHKQDGHP